MHLARIARVEAVTCDSAHEAAWLERNLLEYRRPLAAGRLSYALACGPGSTPGLAAPGSGAAPVGGCSAGPAEISEHGKHVAGNRQADADD